MNMLKVRSQVLTAASIKMAVFWGVAPCSVVEVYRRYRGIFCLHHHGDSPRLYGATPQETVGMLLGLLS
jgi:hypothetical protein